MPTELKKIRIFAASPSDVTTERGRISKVVNALKPLSDYLRVIIEVVDWSKVIPDMGRPEQIILNQLQPSSWDVFVGILWQRFGSPTGIDDPKTKIPYLSGTEEEFLAAYNLWMRHQRPHIVIYRCLRHVDPDKLDLDQLGRIRNFFTQFDAQKGSHPGLYQTFEKIDEFETMLQEHLKNILIEFGKTENNQQISSLTIETILPEIDPSFPRREPFFGRFKEMNEVMNALNPEDRSWGVVIDGIGGIGKTTLAIEAAYRCKEKKMFDKLVFVGAKNNYLATDEIRQTESPPIISLDDFTLETLRLLNVERPISQNTKSQNDLLNILRGLRLLLIYDNLEILESFQHARMLNWMRHLPQGCKAIVTTRRRGEGYGAHWLRLERLEWDASYQIIENQAKYDTSLASKIMHVEKRKIRELYDETMGSPLALMHQLNLMRRPTYTIDNALESLRGRGDPLVQEFIFQGATKDLEQNDRVVLFALSFFMPSANLEALIEITSITRITIELSLDRLVAHALVDYIYTKDRYAIHPFTRSYARKQLNIPSEIASNIVVGFFRYWANFAQLHDSTINPSTTYNRIDEEWGNLQVSIQCLSDILASKKSEDIDINITSLVKNYLNAIDNYLWFSGNWAEYKILNTLAYELMIAAMDWNSAGYFAQNVALLSFVQRNVSSLEQWHENCVNAWGHNIGLQELGLGLRTKGLVAYLRKDFGVAHECFAMTLSIWNDMASANGIFIALCDIGNLFIEQKKHQDAEKYYKQALNLSVKSNDMEGQSITTGRLGEIELACQNLNLAKSFFSEELDLANQISRVDLISHAKSGLARVMYQKDPIKAMKLIEKVTKIEEKLQSSTLLAINNFLDNINSK